MSELHPTRDLLPGLECYGQNEIFELARDDTALVGVLARFMPDDAESTRQVSQVRKALADNAERLARTLSRQDELEQDLTRLPKLNEQVAQFKALGIEAKLKQVLLVEKERQLKPQLAEEWERVESALQTFEAELPDLTFLSDTALDGLPHAEVLRRGRALLDGIRTGAANAVEQLRGQLDRAKDDVAALTRDLEQGLDAAERGLEAEFAKLRSRHGRADQDHPAAAGAQRPAPGVRGDG
ncbi:hypothetical protein [Halochromatium glycolicum]|uniref:Uncharacterized protein n=1 Tax=Halochromatium glycolicum TaxID=85075 RepID=A0AAJ0XAT2_9GAMM|nr:hypothetical protein [Halochromatium glycolicum]MBK1705172.1 hypothetical protein [Halochromatium glycolicum]